MASEEAMEVVVKEADVVEAEWVGGEEEEDDELSLSSDSEIGDALDYLDSRDDDGFLDGGFTLNSWRPNAHGGIHSQRNGSALQPLSNRTQKFVNHIRASPLEVSFFWSFNDACCEKASVSITIEF